MSFNDPSPNCAWPVTLINRPSNAPPGGNGGCSASPKATSIPDVAVGSSPNMIIRELPLLSDTVSGISIAACCPKLIVTNSSTRERTENSLRITHPFLVVENYVD